MTGNIDLSRMITAAQKADAVQEAHDRIVRHECRRRILSVVDEITQMNLGGALLVHHIEALRGGTEADCAEASGLSGADVRTVLAMRRWITDMLATCPPIAADPEQAPSDDSLWPAPPPGLATLGARF